MQEMTCESLVLTCDFPRFCSVRWSILQVARRHHPNATYASFGRSREDRLHEQLEDSYSHCISSLITTLTNFVKTVEIFPPQPPNVGLYGKSIGT